MFNSKYFFYNAYKVSFVKVTGDITSPVNELFPNKLIVLSIISLITISFQPIK